jgi:hypothetical protein
MVRVTAVAKVLLAIATLARLGLLNNAATFIHSDSAGGTKLLEFDKDKCGLVCLQEDRRISIVRAVKTGQRSTMTQTQAKAFAMQFDPLLGS